MNRATEKNLTGIVASGSPNKHIVMAQALVAGDHARTAIKERRDYISLRNKIQGVPAAKGVRHTTFNVNNAVPGSTGMPFENPPTGQAVNQQYETRPGMLNLATGTITLPEDGIYSATGHFAFPAAMTGGTLINLYFSAGLFGVGAQRVGELREPPGGASTFMATITGEFAAAAGDSVQLAIGQNTGAAVATGAGNSSLPWYLAVHKVAELP